MTYPDGSVPTHVFTSGTTAQSAQVNANFNEIATLLNGNILNAHISGSAAIALTKLNKTTEFQVLRSATAACVGAGTTGDTVSRIQMSADGELEFGAGSASAVDIMIKRVSSSVLGIRNVADNADRGLTASTLTLSGAFTPATVTLGVVYYGDGTNQVALSGNTSATLQVLTQTGNGSVSAAPAWGTLNTSVLTAGTLGIARGGTNNGSLGVSALGIYVGDGSKIVQITGTASQQFRVNAGGTAIEAFTPSSYDIAINTCEFRLTLTTGTAVTTADVTAATTIYFTPCYGNRIALYDGSSTWALLSSPEVSASLAGLTASLPYDVFAYNNSGTLTLELLAWTNTTTRATAIAYQNGVPVKTGSTNKRLVGTILITASTGQCEDSTKFRGVSNVCNRVPRSVKIKQTTNNWTYNSSTFRPFNNDTTLGTGKATIMACLDDVSVRLFAVSNAFVDTPGDNTSVGIGINSTSTNSADLFGHTGTGSTIVWPCVGEVQTNIAARVNDVYPLENVTTGTCTFYGDVGNGSSATQSGLVGAVIM